MAWGDPDVEEVEPSLLEIEQLRQSQVQFEDYKSIYRPSEVQYVTDAMNKDYSGYASTRASAESAQTAGAAREKMGPAVVSSGSGLGNLTDINAAQGAGTAAGVGQALAAGQTGIIDRQLNALESGLGLASNISTTTSQAANSAASRARTVAEQELSLSMDEKAGQTQLVTDVSSSYLKGMQSTGSANPFEWKGIWDEKALGVR